MPGERGPLILGSGGRVGTMFRRLAARGLWPGAAPVWHTRDGRDETLAWDMGRAPPPGLDAEAVAGIFVLARAPDGAGEAALARAALDLARRRGLGRVLLCSSQAVYGRASGPCAEAGPAAPETPNGHAKLALEAAAGADPLACALRVGNVAGADALFGAMAAGPVTLDRLEDGAAPRRAYVGPLTLARAMVALLARDHVPAVLNLAQPGLLPMSDLLDAARVAFAWRVAPPAALPALEMDLSRLTALAPLPPATPHGLVAEARLAGWRPFGEGP